MFWPCRGWLRLAGSQLQPWHGRLRWHVLIPLLIAPDSSMAPDQAQTDAQPFAGAPQQSRLDYWSCPLWRLPGAWLARVFPLPTSLVKLGMLSGMVVQICSRRLASGLLAFM